LYTLLGLEHCDELAIVVTVVPLMAMTPPFQHAAYTTPLLVSLYTLEGPEHCDEVAIVVTVVPLMAMTPPP
jgi:hypothetical protein